MTIKKNAKQFTRRQALKTGAAAAVMTSAVGIAPKYLISVNGGAKLVHPGGAKLVHLTLCGTRCWGVVPVVHRRDPRCFVSRLRYAERSSVGGSCGPTGSTIAPAVKQVFLGISAVFGFG